MKDAIKEGVLSHQEVSPTAASVGSKLYDTSGVITYRVQLMTSLGGFVSVDVDAATGDEAAAAGLSQVPGAKVTYVGPAPRKQAA